MTNRILLHAHANENTIQFRTISARMKSPQRFYITYDELDRLRRDGWDLPLDAMRTEDCAAAIAGALKND